MNDLLHVLIYINVYCMYNFTASTAFAQAAARSQVRVPVKVETVNIATARHETVKIKTAKRETAFANLCVHCIPKCIA
jgi:hypothetical protein